MYNVLIVDDEPAVLQGMANIIDWESLDLKIAGFAQCGTEALELILKEDIQILITDIKMPYMDGLELIKKIRQDGKNIKCIILSGFDDFLYVKEAAKLGIENYLLKPLSEVELVSTLQTTLQKIHKEHFMQSGVREGLNILKNNILQRWVTNNIDQNELRERAALLNIDLKCRKYHIVIIKDITHAADSDHSVQKWNASQKSVMNALETMLSGCPCFIFMDMDEDFVILVLNTNEQQDFSISGTDLPGCIRELHTKFRIDTYITIGRDVHSYQDVPLSYNSAKSLQEYRLIQHSGNVISFGDIQNSIEDSEHTYQHNFNDLASAVIHKNTEEAFLWIDTAYGQLLNAYHIKPSTVRNFTVEALFTIINAVKAVGMDLGGYTENKDLYKSITSLSSLFELATWLKTIVQEIIEQLQTYESNESGLFDRMLAYIHSNFTKDLNLKTIANEFHSNPAYLGQLFKKETGQSFTSYLNNIRVQKAKELLVSSKLKINEVSEKVGYFNVNYFYTIFKKLTGFSVMEFKEGKGML
jgi:two-component system, response regulator YesN